MEGNGRNEQEANTTAEICCLNSFRLHMVTWNVATADPPDDVTSLLHLNSPKTPDIYVIGLQEVSAAPPRFIIDQVFDDPWSQLMMSTLASQGYLKVSSIRMQGLLLLFFSKLSHVPFIRDIQATYTRTGLFGYWGNKGGVSIRLSFYGHMLCFLNCHLAAHMDYATQRIDELQYILDTQTFHAEDMPRIQDHKLVFLLGDLNFRIQDHNMQFLHSCINSQSFDQLWSKDQLIMRKKTVPLLQDFEEGLLNFQPTYKFDRFSNNYDTRPYRTWLFFHDKKRKPAWTDRILWRLKPKAPPPEQNYEDEKFGLDEKPTKMKEEEELPLKIKQDSYSSNMEYDISDHKPVTGMFTLELHNGSASPLVRVYAEGDWSADMDAMVIYSPLQTFPSSAWDWIGLYKVGFSSALDYITYTWVKDDQVSFDKELIQVYVSKDEIPVQGGECILCYYSSVLQSIIGISPPFKVQESKVAMEEGQDPADITGIDKLAVSS